MPRRAMVRMDEEGPNASRFHRWIEQRIRAALGLVVDKLGIDPEYVASDGICLRRRVVPDAQGAPGERNEFLQNRDIGMPGEAQIRNAWASILVTHWST